MTAAHIHAGEAGVAGEIVLSLFTGPIPSEWPVCIADADLELLARIAENPGGYYVNIHTEAYPDGAMRGQLEFVGVPTGPTASPSPNATTLPDAAVAPTPSQTDGTPLAVPALVMLALAAASALKGWLTRS